MAVCSTAELLAQACANSFVAVAQDRVVSNALILQLAYEFAGETATIEELQAQACANGFMALAANTVAWRATLLQLLCNATA